MGCWSFTVNRNFCSGERRLLGRTSDLPLVKCHKGIRKESFIVILPFKLLQRRFVLTVIISIISTYFTCEEQIENYLKEYNDEFNKKHEIEEQIETIFEFIDSCEFDSNSRVWKTSDLLTLLVEIHRAFFKQKFKFKYKNYKGKINFIL